MGHQTISSPHLLTWKVTPFCNPKPSSPEPCQFIPGRIACVGQGVALWQIRETFDYRSLGPAAVHDKQPTPASGRLCVCLLRPDAVAQTHEPGNRVCTRIRWLAGEFALWRPSPLAGCRWRAKSIIAGPPESSSLMSPFSHCQRMPSDKFAHSSTSVRSWNHGSNGSRVIMASGQLHAYPKRSKPG